MGMAVEYRLKPEEELVLAFSKMTIRDEEIARVQELLENSAISWPVVFDHVVNHKTHGIFYHNMVKHNLVDQIKYNWRKLFENSKALNKVRNEYMYSEVLPLLDFLKQNGVACIVLKGIVLNDLVYGDYSLRSSSDFDILIQEKDINTVTEFLIEKGFFQSIDFERGEESASRKLKAFYRMYMHEVVPFLKKTDHPFCKVLNVDVQFDIFGRVKHSRVDYPSDQIFSSRKQASVFNGQYEIDLLSPEHNFFQLVAHNYRDMTRIQDIREGTDLRLIQFVDIYEYIMKNQSIIDWQFVAEEALHYQANRIIYYVLYHVEQLFGRVTPEGFMERIAPDDLDYLNGYGFEEGTMFIWKMPFLQRLFDDSRKDELLDISSLRTADNYTKVAGKPADGYPGRG